MEKKSVEIKLKIPVWNFIEALANEQGRTPQDVIEDFTGLNQMELPKEQIVIPKKDRGVFSVIFSIFSQLESLEEELYEIKGKTESMTLLITPIKTCKNIMEVLLSAMDRCVKMPLTESEQNACSDFSILITLLHKDIIERPTYLKRIVRILKKIGLPNLRKFKI